MKRAIVVVTAVVVVTALVLAGAWYLQPRQAAGASNIMVGVDTCAKCAMSIKEPLHAAQFRAPDSEVLKFDDIGCLVLYLNEKKIANPEVYVVNQADGQWVRGETAYYVLSTEKTPMGYGLLAYATGDQAKAASAKYSGQMVNWSELLGMKLERKPGMMGGQPSMDMAPGGLMPEGMPTKGK